jgi:hypothetical protein
MTFLHVSQTQLQISNSSKSRKIEANDIKHYIFPCKMPKCSLTAHKSQISIILAYKWVIRLSPSTVSRKTNSNGYKYSITIKKLQTWLQKENEQSFSTWECCIQKHKRKLCKTPKILHKTQKNIVCNTKMICVQCVGVCAIKYATPLNKIPKLVVTYYKF